MKIVFHSNFMNHHQFFLCEELRKLGVELYFIEHGQLAKERKDLGYHTYQDSFLIRAEESSRSRIYDLTMSADAVIFGSKPAPLFHDRIRTGKLTFNFSERLFKKSALQHLLAPLNYRLRIKYLCDRQNVPYILCAGSYVAGDYARLGYPRDRFLKWGYFPEITDEGFESLSRRKVRGSIIWVGRFIDWKHPEYIIGLAKHLKQKNLSFRIRMIGTGTLYDTIRRSVKEEQLDDVITLMGAMSPEAVRQEFETSEIALITSDRNEGWGAVVNESMSAGCAVVACRQIGSVPYLIRQNREGLVFDSSDRRGFYAGVEALLIDDADRLRIAGNGHERIRKLWNYRVAASRLVDFINTGEIAMDDGPLSRG